MPIIFENPNSPQQPQKGVYGWFATKGNTSMTIYIGQAGNKKTCIPTGTLYRGVSELQQAVFCSDGKKAKYSVIDTDFIVGTAIKFFSEHGYRCAWRHINNDPTKEAEYVRGTKSILQSSNTKINEELKLNREAGYWKTPRGDNEAKVSKINEAEKEIYKKLETLFYARLQK